MQEIYVDDIGTGFPLVLVHGFLGSSAMWSPQKDFLSKYYRLIVPALPGFGESFGAKSLNSISKQWSLDKKFSPKIQNKFRSNLIKGWNTSIKRTLIN